MLGRRALPRAGAHAPARTRHRAAAAAARPCRRRDGVGGGLTVHLVKRNVDVLAQARGGGGGGAEREGPHGCEPLAGPAARGGGGGGGAAQDARVRLDVRLQAAQQGAEPQRGERGGHICLGHTHVDAGGTHAVAEEQWLHEAAERVRTEGVGEGGCAGGLRGAEPRQHRRQRAQRRLDLADIGRRDTDRQRGRRRWRGEVDEGEARVGGGGRAVVVLVLPAAAQVQAEEGVRAGREQVGARRCDAAVARARLQQRQDAVVALGNVERELGHVRAARR